MGNNSKVTKANQLLNKHSKNQPLALFIWLIIRLIRLVFQPEQYFSLIKNQPTVFFSRLIIPAERGQNRKAS
jgi:hypothetical protein